MIEVQIIRLRWAVDPALTLQRRPKGYELPAGVSKKTNAWLATQAPSRSCDNFAALRKFYSLYALRCERESWICLVHESARARLGEGLPTTIACRESLPIPELQSAPN